MVMGLWEIVSRVLSFLGTQVKASAINGLQRSKSSLESLFCYDKSVPEEDIGKPTGLNVEKKNVGDNPPCTSCEAKGAVLCETCAGSGLYVDSILESQGIIVKVRCLGKQDRKYFVHQLCSCHIGNACSDTSSYCRLRGNWKHYVLKMRRPRPHMNSTSILVK